MKPTTAMARDRSLLLHRVRSWFSEAAQVTHYATEVRKGVTRAEQHFLRSIPEDSLVCDIGCGAGRIFQALWQRHIRIVGTDISLPLLRHAQTRASADQSLAVVLTDPLRLPFAPSTFDGIVHSKVIGYFPHSETRSSHLHALAALLRPAGILLLSSYVVPEEALAETATAVARKEFPLLEPGDVLPENRGYVHWFTRQDLEELLLSSPLHLEVFEDDRQYGGAGFLMFAVLRKA
ncbi:MAG: class I SAM-dependent methyltransferase [Chloroflexi bacterium]|nr:class I SAM-dependent methyltransferase [Chloroflexota bacterium]